jgi:hypothetical protein
MSPILEEKFSFSPHSSSSILPHLYSSFSRRYSTLLQSAYFILFWICNRKAFVSITPLNWPLCRTPNIKDNYQSLSSLVLQWLLTQMVTHLFQILLVWGTFSPFSFYLIRHPFLSIISYVLIPIPNLKYRSSQGSDIEHFLLYVLPLVFM